MNSAIERLLKLRVADVMTPEVVSLSSHQTMSQAAALLTNRRISGAPVVDEQGRCVGVLSAADFARRAEVTRDVQPAFCGQKHRLAQEASDEAFRIDEVLDDLVACHMSATVQSVHADESLIDAGRLMCAHHIHRLIVLDASRRPVGILTSLDLTAAVIKAIEE